MPHSTAAELFDPHNPRFTADRFTLLAQMRSKAPVTFLPALHVYAVTRWQEVHDGLSEMLSEKGVEAIGERWRPHRTLAAGYLFESMKLA